MRSLPLHVFLAIALYTSYVVAETLPACAQSCVGITKTKCKPTDFACACSDGIYMPKLTKCIANFCAAAPAAQAHSYLEDLCLDAGAPLQDERLEVRQGVLSELPGPASAVSTDVAQSIFESASGFSTATQTSDGDTPTGVASSSDSPTGPASSSATPSGGSSSDHSGGSSGGSGSGGGGGLSSGAKIGIGLGVPLGVIILVGVGGLAYWLGRRGKKAAAADAQPDMSEPTGPAELDPNAQYRGQELPTRGNTAEMSAPVPEGWKDQQPQHVQPGDHPQPYGQQAEVAELPERSPSHRQ